MTIQYMLQRRNKNREITIASSDSSSEVSGVSERKYQRKTCLNFNILLMEEIY